MQVPHDDGLPECRRKLITDRRPGETEYRGPRFDWHGEQRLLALRRVPKRKGAIVAAACQISCIRRPGQRADRAVRGLQPYGRIDADRTIVDHASMLTREPIPKTDDAVIAAHRKLCAGGGEGSSAHGQASVLVEWMDFSPTFGVPHAHYAAV